MIVFSSWVLYRVIRHMNWKPSRRVHWCVQGAWMWRVVRKRRVAWSEPLMLTWSNGGGQAWRFVFTLSSPINRDGGGFHCWRINCEFAPRIWELSEFPYNLCVRIEEPSEVTMSSLSVTTLFSFVSGDPSKGRSMALDASSSDTESIEKSSRVVGPLSRNDLEAVVSSSSLSAYEGEETWDINYVWVIFHIKI